MSHPTPRSRRSVSGRVSGKADQGRAAGNANTARPTQTGSAVCWSRSLLVALLMIAAPSLSLSQEGVWRDMERRLDQNPRDTANRPMAPDWQFGFEFFHLLFEQQGLISQTGEAALPELTIQIRRRRCQDCVLVITGPVPSWLSTHLRAFVDAGGALLIATDLPFGQPALGSIKPGPVTATDQAKRYLGHDDCFRITELAVDHPLTDGVNRLVANRSGWISSRINSANGRWIEIARLPGGSRAERRSVAGWPVVAAMDLRNGPGRVVMAADHSLFINGMLLHGDNAVFAVNTVKWLSEDRRRLYFVTNGTLQAPRVSSLLPETPLPPLPPLEPEDLPEIPRESMLAFANSFLTELEDSNALNELVANRPRDIANYRYRRWLILIPTLLAAAFVMWRLMRSGQSQVKPAAPLTSTVSAARQQELLDTKTLRPIARELARDLLRTLSGSADPVHWDVRKHPVMFEGDAWQRRTVVRDVERIGRIATDTDRKTVSARALRTLASRIDELREFHSQGRLRLAGAVATT